MSKKRTQLSYVYRPTRVAPSSEDPVQAVRLEELQTELEAVKSELAEKRRRKAEAQARWRANVRARTP